jgi:hypothetical protein
MSAPPASISASSVPTGKKKHTLNYYVNGDDHVVSAMATENIPEQPKNFRKTIDKILELNGDEKWKNDQGEGFYVVTERITSRLSKPYGRTSRQITDWDFVKVDAQTMAECENDPRFFSVISRQEPTKANFERPTEAASSAPNPFGDKTSATPTQPDDGTFAQTVPDGLNNFFGCKRLAIPTPFKDKASAAPTQPDDGRFAQTVPDKLSNFIPRA